MPASPPPRRTPVLRCLAVLVTAATVGLATTATTTGAQADTSPATGVPATVAADALPTWQIDGVVWDTVTIGNIVYATGEFGHARPPGAEPGATTEVVRKNLLAFDIRTGVVTSFAHSLNAQGRRLAVSPDKKTLYVGGDFTKVGSKARSRLAAFDVATGTLKTTFVPKINATVRALAATDAKVYVGGDFTTVGGLARTRLAAVRATTGAPYKWAPTADLSVYALAMATTETRVIIGGRFQKLNGAAKVGIGAVDAVSGKSVKWTSRPIPTRKSATRFSYVTDLVNSGGIIYGTADGEGTHWFDGRFAAKGSNGNLIWLDNCYGATYSGYVRGEVFYSVGHAHDCASIKAFPETDPRSHHRALAETTYATGRDTTEPAVNSNYSKQPVPTLLHWFPDLTYGSYTGQEQAAWAITGNASYVALAGEFTAVNGEAQQGLTRFAVTAKAKNTAGPLPSAGLVPRVTSPEPGTARITFTKTSDPDNLSLKYTVLRDNNTVVKTVTRASQFWKLTDLTYTETGLTPGATHTYKVTVTDPFGNVRWSAGSAPVTIS